MNTPIEKIRNVSQLDSESPNQFVSPNEEDSSSKKTIKKRTRTNEPQEYIISLDSEEKIDSENEDILAYPEQSSLELHCTENIKDIAESESPYLNSGFGSAEKSSGIVKLRPEYMRDLDDDSGEKSYLRGDS